MHKILVLVMTGSETHADSGRMVNAMEIAKEFKEAGDEVEAAGITLLDDYDNHPSVRGYVVDGYQVITF